MERPSPIRHAQVQRGPRHVLQPHNSPSRAANDVLAYLGYSRSRAIWTKRRRAKILKVIAGQLVVQKSEIENGNTSNSQRSPHSSGKIPGRSLKFFRS